ncbi:MAG TPA: serpin family protein [Verrucomicrobiae bacterium]|jgi:serpin B
MKTSCVLPGILTKVPAFIIGLSAVATFAQGPTLALPGQSPPPDNKLADADNGFAFGLLKQIANADTGKNTFISPFSVATALEMVANGAAGQTRAEMQNALNTAGIAATELNDDCKALNQSLAAQTNAILDLANGIWYQNDLKLKPQFISDNQTYFDAELAAVDFSNPSSAQMINDWASKKTFGKIQGVVSYPMPPDTRMVLANAIYFKGKWEDPFEKNLTTPQDFHLPGGSVEQVPMMEKQAYYPYQEGNGFQAVEVSYQGDRLQMILFLPATNSSPQQLLNQFNGDTWRNKILPGFEDRRGDLAFPKFTLNYDVTLNDSLEALGMKSAFSKDNANFSAMALEPLCISEVKQKSYVAVDEEGTEAAAVTTVVMESAAAMEPINTFNMTVDRPFFFVIADSQTQAILFMGIVNNPTP